MVETLEPRRLLATFYVATTGSDSAAGGSATPWRTLQHAADQVAAGDTVIVRAGNYAGFDLRTSGTASARITFRGESGATINAVNPVTNRDGINIENADYITVENFTLIGTNDSTTSRAGIRVVGDGFDTGTFSRGMIIRNNRADRWGYWGIFTGFTDDILIEGNECSRSVREHGIYFSNSADRPTLRGNRVWGNRANGIHMNGDIFTGNTSLPRVDGVITGAVVERNIIHGNGLGGGSGINCDGVRDSVIRNNLLYDNHASGIALYRIDGGASSTGNTIVNNTIIHATDGRWCVRIADASVNNTLFNNIFFNLNPNRGAFDLDADCLPGLKSERNLIEGQFAIDGNFINLAQWRAQTGNDLSSTALTQTTMQALFVNPVANDFALAAASAAIDAGLADFNGTSAPNRDLLALPRPAGAGFDIGAYERGASNNQRPVIVNAPAAAPSTLRGRTTVLTVLGDDDAGEAALTYTWSIVSKPVGAPSPAYSANGTNTAKETTIRFRAAGTYVFRVIVRDAQGDSVSADVTVSVVQKFSGILVSPNLRSLYVGGAQRFAAMTIDQFGRAMTAQPGSFAWSKSGVGRLNSTGKFWATAAGPATVRAAALGTRGSASVTVLTTPSARTSNAVTWPGAPVIRLLDAHPA
jgi:parallel beta-helix repeat protein